MIEREIGYILCKVHMCGNGQSYEKYKHIKIKPRICILFILCLTWAVNANSLQQNIIVIKEICSWLPPFCNRNLVLFIKPRWQLRRTHGAFVALANLRYKNALINNINNNNNTTTWLRMHLVNLLSPRKLESPISRGGTDRLSKTSNIFRY